MIGVSTFQPFQIIITEWKKTVNKDVWSLKMNELLWLNLGILLNGHLNLSNIFKWIPSKLKDWIKIIIRRTVPQKISGKISKKY